MSEKKAFVFDTNFIIQKKDLTEVIANLSDRFTVYVTQVSVEERIAQQCRDLKMRYDEVERLKRNSGDIARITMIRTYSDYERILRSAIQKRYEGTFQDNLIPFHKDGEVLGAVLERAYQKRPPFLIDANASDKGFKDALIWESLLSYFKDNGEQEALFITDDGGFTKNSEALCEEFNAVTHKTITIHPNAYYRELLKPELVEEHKPLRQLPDVGQFRERIRSIISDICWVETRSDWGYMDYEKTFTTNDVVDTTFTKTVFEGLEDVIVTHLFDTELPASIVFRRDDRISDTAYKIPMSALESAVKLYRDIQEQFPQYIEQFFSTTASIINQNYQEPVVTQESFEEVDDDELPF